MVLLNIEIYGFNKCYLYLLFRKPAESLTNAKIATFSKQPRMHHKEKKWLALFSSVSSSCCKHSTFCDHELFARRACLERKQQQIFICQPTFTAHAMGGWGGGTGQKWRDNNCADLVKLFFTTLHHNKTRRHV